MSEDRRLAAIMFTDIVGYTALMGSDEDKAFKTLRKNRNIQRPIIKKYRGEWLKEIGDGILASFHTASDAVRCAGEIQNAAKKEGIALRIGIHEGEVVFEGGDVLGDGVNVASRLEEMAEEGCINISGAVYKDIKNKAGITAEFIEEKTLKNIDEPVKVYKVQIENKEKPESSNEQQLTKKNKLPYYLIAGLIVVIIAILILQFLPTKDTDPQSTEETSDAVDKSIAVLPFRNDSPDQENEYFCNGMVEEILTHLQKIEDLSVKSRTSSEQYRNPEKDLMVIAKELNVAFILEGSIRKVEEDLRITVQLIDGESGDHIWAETYDGKYTDKIFEFQSNVAKQVASSLNAYITPEEEQQIDSAPTTNVTAYDYFLQALEERRKYWESGWQDTIALKKAEMLYEKVLKLDPEYAPAWNGKGAVYWDRYASTEKYYDKNYLDSVLWYCDKAIAFDSEFPNSYLLKGMVYHIKDDIDLAIKNYKMAVELDENYIYAPWRLGYLYIYKKDYINGISLIKKTIQKARGSPPDYREFLGRLGFAYMYIGAFDKARDYITNSRNLGDLCLRLCYVDLYQGNFQASIDCSDACCQTDTTNYYCNYFQATAYLQLKEFDKSVKYFRKYRKRMKELGMIQLDNLYREGYAMIQMGHKEEGTKLIEEQLVLLDKRKRLGRSDGYDYHYAAISAYRGDHEKALQYLRDYDKKVFFSDIFIIPISYTQHDIMFENLWENEEFKAIIQRQEKKFVDIRAEIDRLEEEREL